MARTDSTHEDDPITEFLVDSKPMWKVQCGCSDNYVELTRVDTMQYTGSTLAVQFYIYIQTKQPYEVRLWMYTYEEV
jgi:hypothetical protein